MSDTQSPSFFGRRAILSDVEEVTPENVAKVISDTISVHNSNKLQIERLYGIYKGDQDVLRRSKQTRPEICNNVVVNYANEVVSFKTSYILGSPLQYSSSALAPEGATDDLTKLNEIMRIEGKAGKDIELANWFHIGGVAYRLILPNSEAADRSIAPVRIITLDPRDTYVIHYSGVTRHPIAGVNIVHRLNNPDIVCVYTKRWYMEMSWGVEPQLTKSERVYYPEVPIVEYVHNQARMGAFEVVQSQINAINTLESNRVDAIEQFVQSLIVFENCDVDAETYDAMRAEGALKVKSTSSIAAKVYAIGNELKQDGAQQVIDDLYASLLSICGMPSTQNGGASTSDTGAAVIYRDGWSQAESRAKETEGHFEPSEYRSLSLILHFCRVYEALDLKPEYVKLSFTRRNYADIMTKAQVLNLLLQNPKVSPKLPFEVCGLFVDADAAYNESRPYIEAAEAMAKAQLQNKEKQTSENGSRSTQPDGVNEE